MPINDNPDEVITQAARKSVLGNQKIWNQHTFRRVSSQIEKEKAAASSKLNDEMRLMRRHLLPSVTETDNGSKRGSESRHHSRKLPGKRSKSDGQMLHPVANKPAAGRPMSPRSRSTCTRSNSTAFPQIENNTEMESRFLPMTYYQLKSQLKEVGSNSEGHQKDKRLSLNGELEGKIQSFYNKASRSPIPQTKPDGTPQLISAGQRLSSTNQERPSVAVHSPSISGGFNYRELSRLTKIAASESEFFDDIDFNKSSKGEPNSQGKMEAHPEEESIDSEDESTGFSLVNLPPTRLPPIYAIAPKMIGNQNQNLKPGRQHRQSTPMQAPGATTDDWSTLSQTRYIRPKAKRIQDWYDEKRRHSLWTDPST